MKTISNDKRLNAVAQKVVLQINCKLGGELWGCKTPYPNLMVCGIDVFHDKSRKSGSIAGMVSSVNDALSRYYTSVKIQKQGQEIMDSLKIAFMEALVRYNEINGRLPETIVVFRDGVSDSQMDTVSKSFSVSPLFFYLILFQVADHEAKQFLRTVMQGLKAPSHHTTTATVESSSSSSSDASLIKKYHLIERILVSFFLDCTLLNGLGSTRCCQVTTVRSSPT